MDDRELTFKAQELAGMANAPVGQNLQPLKEAIARIHEQGYIAGIDMERKLMRLRLGLAVPGDGNG